MLVRLENGVPKEWPLAEHYLQYAHPNISFPVPLALADIEPFGYGFFEYTDEPAHNLLIHDVIELPPTLVGDVYKQTWHVVAKYGEDEEAAILAAHNAAQLDAAKAKARETAKIERTKAVASIVVTVGDKSFDGDEDSQTRMARAILIAQATGLTTATWTLADNTVTEVTLGELTHALALAGQRQAELWPLPT